MRKRTKAQIEAEKIYAKRWVQVLLRFDPGDDAEILRKLDEARGERSRPDFAKAIVSSALLHGLPPYGDHRKDQP